MNIATGKACTRCGVFYAYAEGFHCHPTARDGRQTRCKSCIREVATPAPTVDRKCPACGKMFAASLYLIRHAEKCGRSAAVCCSAGCRCLWRRDPARRCVRECVRCFRPFETWANLVIPRKYCSHECAGVRAVPVGVVCETCRRPFYLPPGKAKMRRYCSRHCASISTSTRPPIQTRFGTKKWKVTRALVVRRDGGRCRLCGKAADDLHVHHVVPWRDSHDDHPNNLVTLCDSCHTRADMVLRFRGEILCDNGIGGGLS